MTSSEIISKIHAKLTPDELACLLLRGGIQDGQEDGYLVQFKDLSILRWGSNPNFPYSLETEHEYRPGTKENVIDVFVEELKKLL